MPGISVIVPCLNEEESLPPLVVRFAALAAAGDDFEVVAVDDGSRDGTWATLQALAREHSWLRPVRHPRNLGLAEAWQTGLVQSRAALVCLIDADGQYRPEDIARLTREMSSRSLELVQGARRWVTLAPATRFLISRATSGLLNLLFGMSLPDNKSGFVLCRKDVLERLLVHRHRYRYFQLLLMVTAHRQGVRYASVEVSFEPRRHGVSAFADLPLRTMARAAVDIGRAVFDTRLAG